jgi:iron complex outermembrane recepter protein
MKSRKPTIRRGLLLAMSAAAVVTSLSQTAAFAADTTAKASEELTEVIVTGSILRRTDTETPSPVTVITAEDLQQRGINTVAEGLQRLTANGAGTLNGAWNGAGGNFASGGSAVSLRGLTVQATLTVFDGLRMSVYPFADDGHRNFVDLNTIPDAVIDRIEVLKDGASSTYGADAIAGVVNVITKKEVTGFHVNGTGGTAVRGGGTERRLDATWGKGKLDADGYNFYVSGEFQKTDPIWARNLSYPSNSENLSGICDSAGHCMVNHNIFGITNGVDDNGVPFSALTGSAVSFAPTVAAATAAGGRAAGSRYRLLNTAAGCNVEPGLFPVTLTAAQAGTSLDTNQCGADRRNLFGQVQGEDKRTGGFARFTAKVLGNSEFSTTLAYYNVKEKSNFIFANPLANQTTPAAVTPVVALNAVILPVYVCAAGVGTINPVTGVLVSSGCTAANGTLNPNNPFAAGGQNAILRWRWDGPRTADSDAKSLRGSVGLNGSFGNDWNYATDLTVSKVKIELSEAGNPIPQRIADVVARGSFNFVNPLSNSEAIRQYVAPTSITNSTSDLWQAQVTIGKKLMDLSGGPLQAAVGLSYRNEKLFWESANPDNPNPYNRYYGINSVGADGSRNVQSAFFEVNAPIVKQLEANLSGRYDKYSSGQTNFSPKLGIKYKPNDQLVLRGTVAKGFRIPSFNEAFGLPTTGYSGASVDCTAFAAFCTAHTNNSYVSTPYTIGETSLGNANLNPEKSTSFTLGVVLEPVSNLSLTIDYWNIEVKDLIAKLAGDDRTNAIAQYYANNGVVNIPGITVTPAAVDPAFPNALPLLGFVSSSFNNTDRENASGIDFGANATFQLGAGVKLSSSFDTSYLHKYYITRKSGSVEVYQGTLSPCDYTSCAGSPKWRSVLSNTLAFDKLSVTGTAYYTGSYDLAEVDYGGVAGDCVGSANSGAGSPTYYNTEIPVACKAKATWNFDLNARYAVNDKITVFVDALNVFNIQPPFDPSASYSNAYFYPQYNVAWAGPNAIGRFFRVGLKADF